MKIGRLTNGISCEYKMQDKMKEWLMEKDLSFKPEVYVKEVNRRADFLVHKDCRKLINIEAKCNDFICMMAQLQNHSKYCDYSFAFIPDYPMTPKWFKKELAEKGYGLIVYNVEKEIITEVLEAHINKPLLKKLKEKMLKLIYRKQTGKSLVMEF